jgi:hypothetical protein
MKKILVDRFFDFGNDEFGYSLFWSPPTVASRYTLYDPKTHDLVPKESYKKELISKKEKEIADLDLQKKALEESLVKLKENT